MTDSSRAQGGLICVAVVVAGALFLLGLLQQSYWALALPVACSSSSCSGSTFWVGCTIATMRVEPEQDAPPPRRGRRRSAAAAAPSAERPCASRSSPTAATCTAAVRASTPPTSRASGSGRPRRPRDRGAAAARARARHPAARDPERERVRRAAPATGRAASKPFALLAPLNLWELGVSRFGVFPEMQTFGLRLLLRWRALHGAHRFDVVFDNQCLSGACSASAPPACPWCR